MEASPFVEDSDYFESGKDTFVRMVVKDGVTSNRLKKLCSASISLMKMMRAAGRIEGSVLEEGNYHVSIKDGEGTLLLNGKGEKGTQLNQCQLHHKDAE